MKTLVRIILNVVCKNMVLKLKKELHSMNLSLKKGVIYSSKCNKLCIFSMVGALHYITDEFIGNCLLM